MSKYFLMNLKRMRFAYFIQMDFCGSRHFSLLSLSLYLVSVLCLFVHWCTVFTLADISLFLAVDFNSNRKITPSPPIFLFFTVSFFSVPLFHLSFRSLMSENASDKNKKRTTLNGEVSSVLLIHLKFIFTCDAIICNRMSIESNCVYSLCSSWTQWLHLLVALDVFIAD